MMPRFATRVLVWNDRITKSIDRPNTGGISYDCAFDRHGDFWYSAHSGGLNPAGTAPTRSRERLARPGIFAIAPA